MNTTEKGYWYRCHPQTVRGDIKEAITTEDTSHNDETM